MGTKKHTCAPMPSSDLSPRMDDEALVDLAYLNKHFGLNRFQVRRRVIAGKLPRPVLSTEKRGYHWRLGDLREFVREGTPKIFEPGKGPFDGEG